MSNQLSTGLVELDNSIQVNFPHLTQGDVVKIREIILSEVARRFGRGEAIAFLKLSQNGQAEIMTLALHQI